MRRIGIAVLGFAIIAGLAATRPEAEWLVAFGRPVDAVTQARLHPVGG